jgi:type I site-specific restriction-modification system R (restriction) subunit
MTATKTIPKDASQTLKKLDSLLETLKEDLSSLKTDDSIKMIDKWYSLIQQSKEPEFKEIATGLKDLQKLLKSKDAGHDLGELLSHLGEQTSNIATDADKEIKLPLQNLGKQLAKVGRSLAKEEDQHYLSS